MKNLVLFFVIVFSATSFAQETIAQQLKDKKEKIFIIGIDITPAICYRTIKKNPDYGTSDQWIKMLNDYAEPVFGYTAGLHLRYILNNHLGLECGIQHAMIGYAYKSSPYLFGDMIDPRYGFTYMELEEDLPSNSKVWFHYYYLNIPVKVIYAIGKNRLKVLTSFALTTNFFLKSTETFIENSTGSKSTFKRDYNFKKANLSSELSIGISYNVNQHINLSISPSFSYGLFKIIESRVNTHLWNSGINIGINYML